MKCPCQCGNIDKDARETMKERDVIPIHLFYQDGENDARGSG